jgi:hypothetical protein
VRIAAATIALAACTSASTTPPPPPYTVDMYEDDLGAMHCQRMKDCCTHDEYQDWWTTSDGQAYDCVTAHQNPADRTILVRGVKNGTIEFDPEAAHACVAALETLDCSSFEPGIRYRESYCASPFHGTLVDGAPCGEDDDCASTLCVITDSQHQSGKCQERLADGDPCDLGPNKCPRFEACQIGTYTCGFGYQAGAVCPGDSQCADDWCKGAGFLKDGTCVRACDGQ